MYLTISSVCTTNPVTMFEMLGVKGDLHHGHYFATYEHVNYLYLSETDTWFHDEPERRLERFLSHSHIRMLNDFDTKFIFESVREALPVKSLIDFLDSNIVPFEKIIILVCSEQSKRLIDDETIKRYGKKLKVINVNYFEYFYASKNVDNCKNFLSYKKDKKFNMLIRNTDHSYKILFYAGLIRNNLINDEADISFFDYNYYTKQKLTKEFIFELIDYFDATDNDLLPYARENYDHIKQFIPKKILTDDGPICDSQHGPYATFARSLFSVTIETQYCIDYHLTEKTFKPIAVKVPFIMFCGAGALRDLKNMGYKTFHPYINEAYDNETDDLKRLYMILDEINRLASMSFDDLKLHLAPLEPILEHNYQNFIARKTDPFKNADGLKELIGYEKI